MARVLKAEEAATYLNVHVETVRRLARSGKVPAIKVGRGWRFPEAALSAWAQAHRLPPEKFHVLAIDDEPPVLHVVERTLTGHGYRVSTALSGEQALDIFRRDPPDTVLLDLLMPGMAGPAVMREINKIDQSLPVIILTGYPDGHLMMQAMDYSPFLVLPKPSSPAQLVRAVEMALGSRKPGATAKAALP